MEGWKTGGIKEKQKQERNDKSRGGGVNEGKKKERAGVHNRWKDCGMDEEEEEGGRERERERERERPDLLQCDPLIWGVGVTT